MLRLSCLKVYYCPSKQIHRLASWFSHRTEVVWESGTPPVVFGSSFAKRMGRHLFLFFFIILAAKLLPSFPKKKSKNLSVQFSKNFFIPFYENFAKELFQGDFSLEMKILLFFGELLQINLHKKISIKLMQTCFWQTPSKQVFFQKHSRTLFEKRRKMDVDEYEQIQLQQ